VFVIVPSLLGTCFSVLVVFPLASVSVLVIFPLASVSVLVVFPFASVSVFVFDFFQDYYITGLAYSRLILLFLTIGSIFYLYYRRNSFKSRINLDGSED